MSHSFFFPHPNELTLLMFVDDVLDDLGSREYVEKINDILENGTGAERQLRVYAETKGDIRAVTEYITQQTELGLLDNPSDFMPDVSLPSEDSIAERSSSHITNSETLP